MSRHRKADRPQPQPQQGRLTVAGSIAILLLTLLVGWSIGSAAVDALGSAGDEEDVSQVAVQIAPTAPLRMPQLPLTQPGGVVRSTQPPMPAPPPPAPPACTLPAPSAQAQVVVFGTYSSQALADVSVGGSAAETNTVEVQIEPGDTPLYVVATSYEAMIWRFTGATERVEQAALLSFHGDRNKSVYAGATGLRARRVSVQSSTDCLSGAAYYKANSVEGVRAAAALATVLGRPADLLLPVNRFGTGIALPSGTALPVTAATLPAGFDPTTWRDAQRFYKGGLVSLDPSDVVSPTPAEKYKVLPNQMGISQLVGSGALQPDGYNRFRIVKPIPHYPASMGGAHSVTLILGSGIPVPAGHAGHSCVLDATGKALGQSIPCR